jgi:hypothetical protein
MKTARGLRRSIAPSIQPSLSSPRMHEHDDLDYPASYPECANEIILTILQAPHAHKPASHSCIAFAGRFIAIRHAKR